jgi:hypothetical protein
VDRRWITRNELPAINDAYDRCVADLDGQIERRGYLDNKVSKWT